MTARDSHLTLHCRGLRLPPAVLMLCAFLLVALLFASHALAAVPAQDASCLIGADGGECAGAGLVLSVPAGAAAPGSRVTISRPGGSAGSCGGAPIPSSVESVSSCYRVVVVSPDGQRITRLARLVDVWF